MAALEEAEQLGDAFYPSPVMNSIQAADVNSSVQNIWPRCGCLLEEYDGFWICWPWEWV